MPSYYLKRSELAYKRAMEICVHVFMCTIFLKAISLPWYAMPTKRVRTISRKPFGQCNVLKVHVISFGKFVFYLKF